MTDIQALLSNETRAALQQLALSQDIDGRRAAAWVADRARRATASLRRMVRRFREAIGIQPPDLSDPP